MKTRFFIILFTLFSSIIYSQNKKNEFIKEKALELTDSIYNFYLYDMDKDDKPIIEEISASYVNELINLVKKKGDNRDQKYYSWRFQIVQSMIYEIGDSAVYAKDYADMGIKNRNSILTEKFNSYVDKIIKDIYSQIHNW